MKVEPTGVVMMGVCQVQTDKCTGRTPAPITAVWIPPGRRQMDVCRACLEEQMRKGEWEVEGARLEPAHSS